MSGIQQLMGWPAIQPILKPVVQACTLLTGFPPIIVDLLSSNAADFTACAPGAGFVPYDVVTELQANNGVVVADWTPVYAANWLLLDIFAQLVLASGETAVIAAEASFDFLSQDPVGGGQYAGAIFDPNVVVATPVINAVQLTWEGMLLVNANNGNIELQTLISCLDNTQTAFAGASSFEVRVCLLGLSQ
jgi:hypothetical protein